ncbi:MAG: SGNH/GDSL hydrolase family protein [Isosphaeraceae bacterium]|nr:SGNH/GDSL hydrolase family protein [Isosphaeraceae bacterium]
MKGLASPPHARLRTRFAQGRHARPAVLEPATRQLQFSFLERRERLELAFKRAIIGLTLLVLCGLLVLWENGRYNVMRFVFQGRSTTARTLGLPSDRWAIEADWRIRRSHDIEVTRRTYRASFEKATPEIQRLLAYGGLTPDDAVFRWGNYNLVFALPSRVFTPDDAGRSYRMRPYTRSVWIKGVLFAGDAIGPFLMPDTPELRRLVAGTGAVVVPGSTQTTNSWGCRGPEPDVNASLRGLVLGDSNMQGLLVGDDETPPECLRRELEGRYGTRVSLLNTGHLGYSPEQFYHALVEYGDRFRPHFVVFSFCMNDFGTAFRPNANPRDLEDGQHWVDQIFHYCRARSICVIAAPVPHEAAVTGVREEGNFPGRICDILPIGSLAYCNPYDAFADEHLRLTLERQRRGEPVTASPLFNGPLNDLHMSALGTALWGKVVGRRLALLLERERLEGRLQE